MTDDDHHTCLLVIYGTARSKSPCYMKQRVCYTLVYAYSLLISLLISDLAHQNLYDVKTSPVLVLRSFFVVFVVIDQVVVLISIRLCHPTLILFLFFVFRVVLSFCARVFRERESCFRGVTCGGAGGNNLMMETLTVALHLLSTHMPDHLHTTRTHTSLPNTFPTMK